MLPCRRLALPLCSIVALIGYPGCASRSGPQPDRIATPLGSGWASQRHRDHPLVGRIWDARSGRFATEQELDAAVSAARLLLLGEVHDNADHHLLQARLVRVASASGRHPAIAFEMLDASQQPAIDAIQRGGPANPSALRDAVRWDESGWPDFKLYRPIFEAASDAGLRIVAANLPREDIRKAARSGESSLPAEVRERIDRQGPLPPAVRDELRVEMAESHCGELPESMLDPLILAQRARDAQLATRLVEAAGPDGAILITGSGHVRRDRGVPSYLTPQEASAGGGLLAIAFDEVSPDREAPEDYDVGRGADRRYDFVVFTPGAEREDPCEKLREQLQRSRKHPPVGEQDGGAQL